MPFKAGKSPSDVNDRISKILKDELPKNIEAGLYGMYTVLGGTADFYAPVDTTALIKSRDRKIEQTTGGWKLTYGYYTEYAAALHDPEGELKGWKPKPPNTQGKKGGGYNPNAREGWMTIAWSESGEEAMKVFASYL